MKEMFIRFVFAIWIRVGLSMFNRAKVSAPIGTVKSIVFYFEEDEIELQMNESVSSTQASYTYSSNGW